VEGLVRQVLETGYGTATISRLAQVGLSAAVVQSLVDRSVLTRVGRGAFVDTGLMTAGDDTARHVLRATAVAGTWPSDVFVSHTSAALVQGLPLTVRPDRVHGCRRATGQHRRTRTSTIHGGYVDARSTTIRGVEVLETRFVVMGVAELHGRDEAVVVGDAALRRGDVSLADLRAAAEARLHHPVHRTFLSAIDAMDPASESAGESRSRLLLVGLGYQPRSQVVIRDANGAFIGRVDFLLDGTRVVVEFDGLAKYGSAEDLAAEKRRELRLRAAGYTVVRLLWSDLDRPARVRGLVEAALRADRAAR
jgi:very-short-patch-repair endonuclease